MFVVLLWVYNISIPGKLENVPKHGGKWTYDAIL